LGLGGSGFEETDEAGRKYWAYGGDMEVKNYTNDANFNHNGLVCQITPHPAAFEVKKVYQDILFSGVVLKRNIEVENGFGYTNLIIFQI
jgi:beta-galactosidase